jgi:IclR family KDG regulon transcriptional repressor
MPEVIPVSESVRAVERALDVLMCFSRQTPELNMTQIAERTGVHKSTVHRLLATLEKNRFVERDPVTGIYRPGISLLQVSYLALEENDLRKLAAPIMRQLNDTYQENIHLAVPDECDVVFVHILESPQRIKLAAAIGQRLPAFATASGKAVLAFMPQDKVQSILSGGMPCFTAYPPTSPEALFADLERTRAAGFAVSEREYEDEINAVAAPIFDRDRQPLASIAVAGPAYRLTLDQMLKIGPQLVAAAQEIMRELDVAEPHAVKMSDSVK